MCDGESDCTSPRDITLPPLVVVVVNWNGRRHLADCLGSLALCGYPSLQVVLVDNGSQDGSVEFVRSPHLLATGTPPKRLLEESV